MTLLEESFPIEKLNPVALAEGNAKKPVYRMHKWRARRLARREFADRVGLPLMQRPVCQSILICMHAARRCGNYLMNET